MTKISYLDFIEDTDGNEAVPALKDGVMGRIRSSALVAPHLSTIESARDAAIAASNPQADEVSGLAATSDGELFSFYDAVAGEVRLVRNNGGVAQELYTYFSASRLGVGSGASVQQALEIAATPLALIASSVAPPEGSTVRTANGYAYEVAPAASTDWHIQNAAGTKFYFKLETARAPLQAFGAAGTGLVDDQPALQRAANSGLPIVGKAGLYYVEDSTVLTHTSNRIDWFWEDGAAIKNGITGEGTTTSKGIFEIYGSVTELAATINGSFDSSTGKNIVVSDTSEFVVGECYDFLPNSAHCTTNQFGAMLKAINAGTNTLTFDRAPTLPLKDGGLIRRRDNAKGRFTGHLEIDFNSTTASPKYVFGVISWWTRNLKISGIYGDKVAKKVVRCNYSIDGEFWDIYSENATATDAGQGYAFRAANSNDNEIWNVRGNSGRHVVDFTSSSRNTARRCEGLSGARVDFLTHFSANHRNQFLDCISTDNGQSGYSFTPEYDDRYNVVRGGVVRNAALVREQYQRSSQDDHGGNQFHSVIVEIDTDGVYVLDDSCQLYGCTLSSTSVLIMRDWRWSSTFELNNCTIYSQPSGRVAYFTNAGSKVRHYGGEVYPADNDRMYWGDAIKPTIEFYGTKLFCKGPTTAGNGAVIAYEEFAVVAHGLQIFGEINAVGFSSVTDNTMDVKGSDLSACTRVAIRNTAADNVALTIDRLSMGGTVKGNSTVTYSYEAPVKYVAGTPGAATGEAFVTDEEGNAIAVPARAV